MVQCAAFGAADSSLRILIFFDDVMLCHNLNTAWLAMEQPYCIAGLSEQGGRGEGAQSLQILTDQLISSQTCCPPTVLELI